MNFLASSYRAVGDATVLSFVFQSSVMLLSFEISQICVHIHVYAILCWKSLTELVLLFSWAVSFPPAPEAGVRVSTAAILLQHHMNSAHISITRPAA